MTTACVIAAVCALVAGLFAVIVERTNERDRAERELDRLERELEARLTNPATATTVRIPSMTRHLSLVQSDDGVPVADESWLDEITKPGGWS